MPDGSRPTGPDYDDDFYAWTQYQAEVLRSLSTPDNRFDREHLAEEVADLGKSERNAVRSQVERILLHFLKLAYSPAREPRPSWMDSIIEARSALDNQLTPSLRRDAEERLSRLYAVARKRAGLDLQSHGDDERASALPPECPYTLGQVVAEDWYPEPASGDE